MRTSRAVRFLSYNIHRCVGLDGRHEPARIADVIAQLDPDVVALQEVDVGQWRTARVHQAQLLADGLKMRWSFHAVRGRAHEGFGVALLSRLPMHSVRAGMLPTLLTHGLETRGAQWLKVSVGPWDVQVINTHLGLLRGEQMKQAVALHGADWLSHTACRPPRVLCGDFNVGPGSAVYRAFQSVLRDSQTLVDGHRPAMTWPSLLPFRRIDHVFVSPEVRVHRVRVPRNRLTSVASDHLPIVADVSFCVTNAGAHPVPPAHHHGAGP